MFGKQIRKERLKKNITMKQLGEMVGVSEQAISQYERDIRTPNDKTLKLIAEALDVNIGSLFDLDIIRTVSVTGDFVTKFLKIILEEYECTISIKDIKGLTFEEFSSFYSDTISNLQRVIENRKKYGIPKEKLFTTFKIDKKEP
ncbi:helix-turn-helix domain-containing protein [Clostridium tetani]|uniref:helix-turn-helix domain-containing protein n=1 Tax=Clostridium tetani TaxID=1513 RepID=UPI00100B22C2|nr:helix-turn-helix transcriptional regulator [Clostridium tetani]RXM57315.1 hypothetical protein DP133_09385 [Clostridium tetani]RXM77165.1 hypothetical protein DP154_06425 [Clostridium tetani]RYU99410.1 hypothetical protein DP144_06435 [Clostridium tetani]